MSSRATGVVRWVFGPIDEHRRGAIVSYACSIVLAVGWLATGMVSRWLGYTFLAVGVVGLGLACRPLIARVREWRNE